MCQQVGQKDSKTDSWDKEATALWELRAQHQNKPHGRRVSRTRSGLSSYISCGWEEGLGFTARVCSQRGGREGVGSRMFLVLGPILPK